MPSAAPSLTAVRAVVERLGPPGTPLTTSEVAAEFDCLTRAVSEQLETLVGEGVIETKEVGARGRVWWRPVDTPTSQRKTPRGSGDTVECPNTSARRPRADSELAEQALRASEERLHLATEIGGIGIWELDLQTLDSPVRTARHDEIFGYDEPPDDWSFERFLDHVVPGHRDRIERSFEESLRTGVWAFECPIVRVDGQQRWIAARGRMFDDDVGEPHRALGVVQDITDQKRRERELERQRKRLERQNERLEEFTSTVTHDLRSPLAVIGGRLHLYRETGGAEHLDAAEEALKRAGRLVDDLLTVARQGWLVETTKPTDVEAVFSRAREGTVPATVECVYDPVPTILADRDRLLQLFENVLRNSVEHGGSDVTVRVGPLPDGAGLYIEDDGPGFAGVDPERVFDFGYSGREDGTGFGLSIARAIADAHGWEISIGPETSGGARFEITGVEFAADS
ncbi:ATP-binding protein [Haloarchaeobius sp. DT45]|uniref:sensor histidine kinase n=1 Tax=Haloarchaeobius sp. DT45 TaxID=3446116 RepID=UPI003F6B50C9